MSMVRFLPYVAATVALVVISPSHAAAQRSGGPSAGVGVSYNVPSGRVDSIANAGFGVTYRRSMGSRTEDWSTGSTFGFNWFPGKGDLNSVQFFGSSFDISHQSEHLYQFGGLGLQLVKYAYDESSTAPVGTTRKTSDLGFGLTGGIGMKFGTIGGAETFGEIGATTLFTTPKNSTWFPVRFGIRF